MQVNWQTVSNEANLRECCAANILRHIPGPKGVAKRVRRLLESFKLFFTNEIVDMIVRFTNDCTHPVLERFAPVLQNGKSSYFLLVGHIEIKGFFGILHLRSAFHLNMCNTRDLWFHESAHDIFVVALSWNRFHFIWKFITFDDKPTRNDRWKNDKYACMRELFEIMNVQNAKRRFPLPLLATDETLYPYHGAVGFKQDNPNKPVNYGLLHCSLCDTSTLYTYFILPYAGKLEDIAGEAAKFYVTRTD